MKKLTLNIQLKFDNVEATIGDFDYETSGRQDLKIVVEDKEWLDEYEQKNEVEQSLVLQKILGSCIDTYADTYTDFMMELYDFDEEYVQDKIMVTVSEIIED
jgi:hypothetical protein